MARAKKPSVLEQGGLFQETPPAGVSCGPESEVAALRAEVATLRAENEALANASGKLVSCLGEYVRQAMTSNREWRTGVVVISDLLWTRQRRILAAGQPVSHPIDEPIEAERLARADVLARDLAAAISPLPLAAKVRALNEARAALHEVSPFRNEPVDLVLWLPAETVEENPWNPNVCQGLAFEALGHSVTTFGYTMAVVGVALEGPWARVRVIDGFHRHKVGREHAGVRARVFGYLPVSLLPGTLTEADQQSATILHNKARGQHAIQREIPIVASLQAAGWDEAQIGVGLVKSDEELIRLRQTGGIAQRLANPQYDRAWTWQTGKTKGT